jgi:pSer/pThr/pTyr-binding forkhead associated (FHA) protein
MNNMENETMTATDPIEGTDSMEATAIPLGRLVVVRANVETDEIFAFAAPATIGRFDPSVGPIVSRKHAKITCEDGTWMIADLGSSNGTYVRGDDFEKVETSEITNGTEIALGNARFKFYTDSAPAVAVIEEEIAPEEVDPTE